VSNGSGTGTNRRFSRAAALAGVVVLGGIVVAGVLVAGPVRTGEPRWIPSPAPFAPQRTFSGPQQTTAPNEGTRGAGSGVQWHPWLIAAVIAGIVLVIVLVFLLRRLLRRPAVVTASHPALVVAVPPPTPSTPDEEVAAPAVVTGIARAIELLDEARDPHDAIERAWLGLQDAAAASGVRRRPAETPAEYTSRIIARLDTDREAADTLLRLYQEVRFGGHAADASTVAEARECLLRLRSSWHDRAGATGATR